MPVDTLRLRRALVRRATGQISLACSAACVRLSPEFYDLFQVDVDGAADAGRGFFDLARGDERSGTASRGVTRPHGPSGTALGRARPGAPASRRPPARGPVRVSIQEHVARDEPSDHVRTPRTSSAAIASTFSTIEVPKDRHGFRFTAASSSTRSETPTGEPAIDPLEVVDEGYLKATTTSSENKDHPTPSDDLYLHETIAGWEGWSLSAPRPGQAHRRAAARATRRDGSIARHDPGAGNAHPLVSRIDVEARSLPRLRLGHIYRMRMRTVDLAGNSLPFGERDFESQDPDLTSEAQAYLRFEPVPSPTVLRRHLDTEGESLEHLAIRSNGGISAGDYAQLPAVTDALTESGAAHGYAEDSQRHLAPPKGSQLMAEQDGRFDAAFGGSLAQMTTALRMALREEGTFLDERSSTSRPGRRPFRSRRSRCYPPGTPLPPQRGAGLPGAALRLLPGPGRPAAVSARSARDRRIACRL